MTTAADALRRWRAEQSLPDQAATAARWRPLAELTLALPNFRWRVDAIDRHDLHHLLTGIPSTLGGECRIAAWEFGAGAYPSLPAQAFCLPLVLLGVVRAPRATWSSFRLGRSQRSLYSFQLGAATTLADVQTHVQTPRRKARLVTDIARFAGWLALAAGIVFIVPAALLLIWL